MTTESYYYLAARDLQKIDINSNEYGDYYKDDGWVGRKVQAIPSIFIAVVVKTTYHVAMAIIIGIPQYIINDDQKRLDAEGDNIWQDLNEAYAWCVILIDDKEGSLLRDRSCFLKEQNSLWAEGKISDYDTPPTKKPTTPPPTPQRTPRHTPPSSPIASSRKVHEFFTPQRIEILKRVTDCGSHRNMSPGLKEKYAQFLNAEYLCLNGRPIPTPGRSPLLKHRQTGGLPIFGGKGAPPPAPPIAPPLTTVLEEGKLNKSAKRKPSLSFMDQIGKGGFNLRKAPPKEKTAPAGMDDALRERLRSIRGATAGSPKKDLMTAVAASMHDNPALKKYFDRPSSPGSDSSDWEDSSPVLSRRNSDPSPLKSRVSVQAKHEKDGEHQESPLPLPRRLSFSNIGTGDAAGLAKTDLLPPLSVDMDKEEPDGPFIPKAEEGKKQPPLTGRVSIHSAGAAAFPHGKPPLPFLSSLKSPGTAKPIAKSTGEGRASENVAEGAGAKQKRHSLPPGLLQGIQGAKIGDGPLIPKAEEGKERLPLKGRVSDDVGSSAASHNKGVPPAPFLDLNQAPVLRRSISIDLMQGIQDGLKKKKETKAEAAAPSSPPASKTSRPFHEVIASAAKKRGSRESISTTFSVDKQGVPKPLSQVELIQQDALTRRERRKSIGSGISGKDAQVAKPAPEKQMSELQSLMAASQRRRSTTVSDGKAKVEARPLHLDVPIAKSINAAAGTASPSSSKTGESSSIGSVKEAAPSTGKKRKKRNKRKKQGPKASEAAASSRMGEPSAKPDLGNSHVENELAKKLELRRRKFEATVGSPEPRPAEEKGGVSKGVQEIQATPRRKSFAELRAKFGGGTKE